MFDAVLVKRLGEALYRYLSSIDTDMARLSLDQQREKVARIALDTITETHDVAERRPAAQFGPGRGRRAQGQAPGQIALQLDSGPRSLNRKLEEAAMFLIVVPLVFWIGSVWEGGHPVLAAMMAVGIGLVVEFRPRRRKVWG